MHNEQRGFALPTVLIAGTLMLIVLMSGLVAATSVRVSLTRQYFDQIAHEAAESGVIRAKECLRISDNVVTWSDTKPLQQNTDCAGEIVTTCGATIKTAACSVLTGSVYTTGYKVYADVDADAQDIIFRVEGSVNQVRQAGGSAVSKQTYNQWIAINTGVISAQYVQSGHLEVCGIFDGQTWCWGSNLDGRLGNNVSSSALTLAPIKVTRASGALLGKTDKMVAIADGTMCIVTTDDDIYCTGKGTSGQIGNGQNSSRSVPTKVTKPVGMTGTITHMTGMGAGFCAISDGDAYCWGSGYYGKLGNGSTANRNTPIKVSVIGRTASPSTPITEIASDSEAMHVCAIAQVSGSGRAYCWGYDGRGELGDNSTIANKSVPTAVDTSGVLSGKNLTMIVASGRYPETMVNGDQFPTDAEVVSCANARSGDAKRHCARTGQSCVLDSAGKMYCWGANQYGQSGGGSSDSNYSTLTPQWRRPVPYQVTTSGLNSKTITDIAVGRPAVCAYVGSEGLIYCWGFNDRGILGRGSSATSGGIYPNAATVAVQSPGLSGQTIQDLTGGVNRFCTLTTANSVKSAYCWGVGDSAGQLGTGVQQNSNAPIEASMLKKLRNPIIY